MGDILKSVKSEARKIYERYCKRYRTAAKNRAAAKAAAAKMPGSAAAAIAAAKAAGAESAAVDAKHEMNQLSGAGGEAAPAAPGAGADAEAEAAAAGAAGGVTKQKKLLFSPVIAGKEPTPEGMRLSKALNDVATALPVTPAYQLGREHQALHDVLGTCNSTASPSPLHSTSSVADSVLPSFLPWFIHS